MTFLESINSVYSKIANFIQFYPLQNFAELDNFIGNNIQVFIKPEILQTTGSFKVRNAFASLISLSQKDKQNGIVAASTGNLGQALALAGRSLNIDVTICVKRGNSPLKNEKILEFGAELVEYGNSFDDALKKAMEISRIKNNRLIRSSTDKYALLGAATVGYEIFNENQYLDAIFLAIGSGSHAAGAGIVKKTFSSRTKIIGVQSLNASAIHDSWHANKVVRNRSVDTIADAIAIGSDYCIEPLNILKNRLDDFIKVSDEEILYAMKIIYKTTNYIVEPAGAVGLAGLISNKYNWSGRKIGIVLSGGNIENYLANQILNCKV